MNQSKTKVADSASDTLAETNPYALAIIPEDEAKDSSHFNKEHKTQAIHESSNPFQASKVLERTQESNFFQKNGTPKATPPSNNNARLLQMSEPPKQSNKTKKTSLNQSRLP